jgi:HEAT repeat protein
MSGRLTSLVLAMLALMAAVSGCADTAAATRDFVAKPFRKTPEQIYGIKTPKDRVKDYRKLALQAEKMPANQQEPTVAKLTREYDTESDQWVRREILRTVAAFPQPAAGEVVVRALADEHIETRRVACDCLGERGGDVAVRELTRVLGSETNEDVRMSAVAALGKAGDSKALAPLAEALADGDPAMQAEAYNALTAVSGRDYGPNVQAWRELATNGKTDAAEISLAEKLRRTIY